MKKELLLTLKELIKLGVINLKKKKRKNKRKKQLGHTSKNLVPEKDKDPFQKNPFNSIDTYGMGPKSYKPFYYPPMRKPPDFPNFQQNTDALRLRDENANLNTRLMEVKNQQQEQKQEQQQLSKTIDTGMRYILNDIVGNISSANEPLFERGRVLGYADDDNIDTAETFGSENFKTQQDIADPELRPSGTSRGSDVREPLRSILKTPDKPFVEDEEDTIGDEPAREEEQEHSIDSSIGDIQTRIPMRKHSTIRVKRLSFQDTGPRTSLKSIQDERPSGTSRDSDVEFSDPNEGVSGFTFPKVPVPSKSEISFVPNFSTSKTKPKKAEIDKWKEWYLMIGLNDDAVLASNKRNDYIQPILVELKKQYRALNGTDPNILKSTDPKVVHQAIRTKQGY